MASDNLGFSCALATGGGSGIGKALSEYLIKKGKKVIIAGRTESNLASAAKEIGAAAHYVLDTGKISSIPSFVETIISDHPEMDCLINNAGVQRPLRVLEDDPTDFLRRADQEIDIDIRGPMHLALSLLEHFKSKPVRIINPVYNGTKASLHFWSMNLRAQLKGTRIRVVEIAPPVVATDLHREREDPDDNKKEKNLNALSVGEYVDEISKKLEKVDETIGAGIGADVVDKWFATFGEQYAKAAGL